MTIEQLVGDALHAADDFEPSPDLFAKVQRSIEEDTAHRRRMQRVVLWIAAAAVTVLAYLAVTVDITDGTAAKAFTDRVTISFTALEILVTLIMIVLVLVLGPGIKRFGEAYEGEVFRSSPETGAQVLRLLDIAYYLIFGSFILMSLIFDPALEFGGTPPDWIRGEMVRVGGLLMLMAVLHVALLLALPLAGLVFSANERRIRLAEGYMSTDDSLDRVDRAITVAAWILAGFVVLQLVFGVLNGVILLGAPG